MNKIAIVQEPPVFLDREKTIERAVGHVDQAAAQGAELVVFPEAYVPGYPAWVWRLKPGGDWDLSERLHARLLDQAVDLDRGDLDALNEAARRHRITILCGMDERAGDMARATLYNSYVVIGPEGELLNRHRKAARRLRGGASGRRRNRRFRRGRRCGTEGCEDRRPR